MKTLPRLPHRPEVRTETVESLVDRVRRGLIRVPRFQRGLRWTGSDVVKLFDSIYRGYPVGSLLFNKRPAAAERLNVGPVTVDAPETVEAWWVVDGQQRLTSLTACLGRSMPLPAAPEPEDPFVLYFDAAEQVFTLPPETGRISSTWVPLPLLFETTRLFDWVCRWPHRDEEVLRRVVFEAGSRIREYPIPLSLIESEDSKVVEEVFLRANLTGRALTWAEVHTALLGGKGPSPSTLTELSEELTGVGMGRLDEDQLLRMSLALEGRDRYPEDPGDLRIAVQEALPVVRRVLSFLRKDAGIPHIELLPMSTLLEVLARFFALHGDPNPRTRVLLARWFWRAVLAARTGIDPTLRRRGIAVITGDEEQATQSLLSLVHQEPSVPELPSRFDVRADATRIALIAMIHRAPCDLQQGQPIDVAGLLERRGKNAFPRILNETGLRCKRSPANRIIQPNGSSVHRLLLERISEHGIEDTVLASHAIDALAAELLASADLEGFLEARARKMASDLRRFGERMAAWNHSDRPSVEYLLALSGVES